jgi:hypothetical protein
MRTKKIRMSDIHLNIKKVVGDKQKDKESEKFYIVDDCIRKSDVRSVRRWNPYKQQLLDIGDKPMIKIHMDNGSPVTLLESYEHFTQRLEAVSAPKLDEE